MLTRVSTTLSDHRAGTRSPNKLLFGKALACWLSRPVRFTRTSGKSWCLFCGLRYQALVIDISKRLRGPVAASISLPSQVAVLQTVSTWPLS
jgi:hypothetical protein